MNSTHTELARVPLQLIDPADCSPPENPDNLTFGATATLTVTAGVIASIEITPMSPLSFPVLGVQGGKASARYTTTLGVAAELALECSPASVIRGALVSCTATMSDGSVPNVTKWNFASTDPALPGYQQDGSIGPAWTGEMVVSGTVTVTALVKGTPQSKKVDVSVSPRDWSAEVVEFAINVVATPYGDPPANISQLGSNDQRYNVRVDTYSSVSAGPNAGIAYFTRLPYKLIFDVNYNTNAMKVGSVFYNMQPATARSHNGTAYCARSRVTSDIPLVKKHEGFSASDVNSHTDVYKRFFLQEVRTATEKLVAADATSLNPEPVAAAAAVVAGNQSHQITDLSSANPYTTNCVFNFNPTLRIP